MLFRVCWSCQLWGNRVPGLLEQFLLLLAAVGAVPLPPVSSARTAGSELRVQQHPLRRVFFPSYIYILLRLSKIRLTSPFDLIKRLPKQKGRFPKPCAEVQKRSAPGERPGELREAVLAAGGRVPGPGEKICWGQIPREPVRWRKNASKTPHHCTTVHK